MFYVGPFNFNFYGSAPETDSLLLVAVQEYDLPDSSRVPTLEGFKLVYQLKDNRGLKLKLQGKSKHGNPVDFTNEEIEATSSDPAILTVTEDTGFIRVEPVGPIGSAQVQVVVPGVLINGTPLSGMFDVEVVGGDAASISFAPAETFETGEATPTGPEVTGPPAGDGTDLPPEA